MNWWDAYPGLRERVLAWLETVRCKDEPWGRYKYCRGMKRAWGLESSLQAIKILRVLDALNEVPAEARLEMGRFVCSLQDPETGLVADPLAGESDRVSDHFPWEHIRGHATGVAIQALPLLGVSLTRVPRAPDDPVAPGEVAPWMAALPWDSNPWRCGTLIGQFLARHRTRTGLYDSDREDDIQSAAMDWLEARQDPRTGLWGTDRCPETAKAMAGLHCMSTGTYYLPGRPLPRPERVTESILALQQPNGDFATGGGCLNYDAIQGLTSAARYTTHRRREAVEAARRMVERIFGAYARSDGAFSFHAGRCMTTHNSLFVAEAAEESDVIGTHMYLIVLRDHAVLSGRCAPLPMVF